MYNNDDNNDDDICIYIVGDMVDLLIKSNVGSSYLTFKALNDSFHMFDQKEGLKSVPANKADVSHSLSLYLSSLPVCLCVCVCVYI